MNNEALLLAAVFVPTLGAFLLPALGRASLMTRNVVALAMVLVSLGCSIGLIGVASGSQGVTASLGAAGMSFSFHADGLAVFVAIVSSLVSAIILLYSIGYISHYPNQNEYYLMVVLFLGAMMGLVYASNLILLYVFWEITAICSWRLIGFFRDKYIVLRADKAFLITVFGALAMLLGFIAVYAQTGSFDMATIKAQLGEGTLTTFAVALIMLGILSKSATLPFHTWLPDAGVAPSPVTALLHAAILVKIGVYVYARLFVVTFPMTPQWQEAVMVIAAVSALVSAGAALIDTDLKRIIAYSTISQIAFIFLGFASGTQIGIAGALLYILMHGMAKGGLFLCAGIVEQTTHNKDITKMGGLIKTMPVTAVSFLFCSLSVMGVPPFGGFFSKYFVMSGALQAQHVWISMVFLVGAFMTILYLFRVFNLVFLGQSKLEAPPREKSPVMVFCVALLAVMGLVAGLLINSPSSFAQVAVEQMLGLAK